MSKLITACTSTQHFLSQLPGTLHLNNYKPYESSLKFVLLIILYVVDKLRGKNYTFTHISTMREMICHNFKNTNKIVFPNIDEIHIFTQPNFQCINWEKKTQWENMKWH